MRLSRQSVSRAQELLASMSLGEKIAQLGAYMFFDTFWNTHSGYDESERIDFIGQITPEQMIPKEGLGFISTQLRDLPPGEAARTANRNADHARASTRHGILPIIHDEGVHGLIGNGATIFPTALGLAASWDEKMVERVADVIGREARSRGVRQLLSPTLNLGRDPRVGRVEETYGESPVLAAAMAKAFIIGVQRNGVVCTPKHFAGNFEADGGRDSAAAHFSERFLREIILPPFEAAIREGGALSCMCAYNSLNGIPCVGNRWLLTDVLRDEWGLEGYVVADYHAIVHQWELHGTAADKREAAAISLAAGLDVELPRFDCYGAPLREALECGLLGEDLIDAAAARVLAVKAEIGLLR